MKNSDIRIIPLSEVNIEDFHAVFTEAFSDYQFRFQLSMKQFEQRLKRVGASEKFSMAALSPEGHFVGCLISCNRNYQGKDLLYNGGTGVIKEYRGKGVGRAMIEDALRLARTAGLEGSVLEVLDNNLPAIKLYENLGFKRTRFLRCYSLEKTKVLAESRSASGIETKPVGSFDKQLQSFLNVTPTWQNSPESINANLSRELILEAYKSSERLGFISFDLPKAQISQLAVKPEMRGKGIGTLLLKEMRELCDEKKMPTCLNIDSEDEETNNFFIRRGFKNSVNQFEMLLEF